VQLFDTWAGTLPPAEFRRFALPAARSVIERARAAGAPVIYFVNGCAGLLRDLPASGADCLGIDYRVDLSTAISALPSGARVQGNLDPFVLLGSEEVVRARTAEIVEAGRAAAGHVFNLGHGILQQTPVENMAALVDQVHKAGRRAK
jgi:uroporphyrinogen decarboxylase